MDEYLKSMENYTPTTVGTGEIMGEAEIIEISMTPQTTAIVEEKLSDDAPYMAPKTVEVKRYTLKK